MCRGKNSCVTIAIKGIRHIETISTTSCMRFCHAATMEKKLRLLNAANTAIAAAAHWD